MKHSKRSHLYRTFTFVIILSFFASCAAYKPKPTTAKKITKSTFVRYSKKYKESVFGQAGVRDADIIAIQQQSRNIATAESLVSLKDGQVARVLSTFKYQAPFGWRIASWELLSLQ